MKPYIQTRVTSVLEVYAYVRRCAECAMVQEVQYKEPKNNNNNTGFEDVQYRRCVATVMAVIRLIVVARR